MGHFLYLIILQKILVTTDGKDKLLKIAQYFSKAYLLAKEYKTLNTFVAQISLARKVIRLGHGVGGLVDLVDYFTSKSSSSLDFLNITIGIANDFVDDFICMGKIGVVQNKPLMKQMSVLSDRLWYATIYIDMHDNYNNIIKAELKLIEAQSTKSQDGKLVESKMKLWMLKVSRAKLIVDWIFCTYDVFSFEDRGIPGHVQVISGLIASVLGTYKIIW